MKILLKTAIFKTKNEIIIKNFLFCFEYLNFKILRILVPARINTPIIIR